MFGKTQKEVPKDVVVKSHEYLVRAGYIHQVAAGLYYFLPLGYRTLRKIDQIIAEVLEDHGVQHLLMPFVHPASLWKETGRYDKVDVLLKFQSARGADCVLAPTHEETVTELARSFIESYKDLPVIVNQNQWKYRDEMRATGGLLRTREFLMQDAYSFDRDKAGLDKSFETMSKAYHEIFRRMGVEVTVVQADSGSMGGSNSEEFMILTDVGEDKILTCDKCDYKANMEKAEGGFETFEQENELKPMEKVLGENLIGVEPLAEFLGIEVHQTTKTLLFQADDQVVAVMVRGDYDVSETKLKNYLGCNELNLASAETVKKVTGAEVGYAGPIGLPAGVKVVADLTCENRTNFEAGGNETHYHNVNCNFERDFPTPEFVDLREVKEGDLCLKCDGGKLEVTNAIEAGHVFKLGTVYAEAMGAKFVDDDGKGKVIEMGCYGIGISRLVASIAEVNNDENGLVWPKAVAPYQVNLLVLGKDGEAFGRADELYGELRGAGYEVLYDDRNESAGRKFADSDLIGLPVRLVVSSRSMEAGGVEWKERAGGEAEVVKFEDLEGRLSEFFNA